ncbi:hypothetical protein GCM10009830_29700 [Glycomyces endophyticus]|uniref:DUF222 domain-containing protein n=1 Tax=Glycomyces endophyticus TaxID=480996 RepID=A0ABN2H2A6_9ACTN
MAPVDRDAVERELADRLAERDRFAARLLDRESGAAFAALRAEAAALPKGRCGWALQQWDALWILFHDWSGRLAEVAALRDGKGRFGRRSAEKAALLLARVPGADPCFPSGPRNAEMPTDRALEVMEQDFGRVGDLLEEIEAAIAAAGDPDPLAERIDALEVRERRLLARWTETRERISDPRVPEPLTAAAELRERLAEIPGFGEAGWTETAVARKRLGRRIELAESRAETAFAACNTPLHIRNRLRGEAEAYRARAERTGADDGPAFREAWARAKAVLWTAPCSIPEARTAVDDLAALANGDRP